MWGPHEAYTPITPTGRQGQLFYWPGTKDDESIKRSRTAEGSATHTKLGTYLYGIFILCGLVIQDQNKRLQRKYGYKAGNSTNPMIGHMAWFWYEWLHIDNIKLIGIFIGVAIIVSTAISPLDFTRQSVWRTLVAGRLACS